MISQFVRLNKIRINAQNGYALCASYFPNPLAAMKNPTLMGLKRSLGVLTVDIGQLRAFDAKITTAQDAETALRWAENQIQVAERLLNDIKDFLSLIRSRVQELPVHHREQNGRDEVMFRQDLSARILALKAWDMDLNRRTSTTRMPSIEAYWSNYCGDCVVPHTSQTNANHIEQGKLIYKF